MMGKCVLGIRRISVVLLCISLMVGASIGLSGCDKYAFGGRPDIEITEQQNEEMKNGLEQLIVNAFGDDVYDMKYTPMDIDLGERASSPIGPPISNKCPENTSCVARLDFKLKKTNESYYMRVYSYRDMSDNIGMPEGWEYYMTMCAYSDSVYSNCAPVRWYKNSYPIPLLQAIIIKNNEMCKNGRYAIRNDAGELTCPKEDLLDE